MQMNRYKSIHRQIHERRIVPAILHSLMRAMSKDETREHAAQCHRMIAERCPHGRELNMRLEARLDPVSWEAGRRLAKGCRSNPFTATRG